jgi:hypothetical protein
MESRKPTDARNVNLSFLAQNLPARPLRKFISDKALQMAYQMLLFTTDEVARNGA